MPDPTPTPHPVPTPSAASTAEQPTQPDHRTPHDLGAGDSAVPAARDLARAEAAAQFRYFARHRAAGYAPLYARLGEAIAEDADLLDLALLARPGQSRPDLLLAVLHERLLRNPHHPAARFYPSLTAHPDHGDPVPDVVALARAHHHEIADAMRHRLVQTNEVGRCTFLAPAIRTAAALHAPATSGDAAASTPLALLEVGASAGLNLLPDRYGYRYHPDDTGPTHTGPTDTTPGGGSAQPPDRTPVEVPGAPVLDCALDGPGRPPVEPLHITWRAGIDLHPLDVDDPDDRRWLRALVWPDHHDRAALLDAALHAAAAAPRPALHTGDAALLLADVAATAPADAHLVIYHSAVLAHMPDSARDGFTAAVLALSAQRPLSWIQAEPRPDRDPRRLRLTRCRDGRIVAEHPLGSYHPHGRRLRWDYVAAL